MSSPGPTIVNPVTNNITSVAPDNAPGFAEVHSIQCNTDICSGGRS